MFMSSLIQVLKVKQQICTIMHTYVRSWQYSDGINLHTYTRGSKVSIKLEFVKHSIKI